MHTVTIKMHGDQEVDFHGTTINIHDIQSIVIDGKGNIITVNVELPLILNKEDCHSITEFKFQDRGIRKER